MEGRSVLCAACHKAAVASELPTEKVCPGCQRTLGVDSFGLRAQRQGAAKWRSRCKDCEATEKRLQAKNILRDRSKGRTAASIVALRTYAKKLGIPWAEVVERYPTDNRCEICGRTPQEASRTGKYKRLSLDHCHQTGRLRGFLCSPCNSGVGHLGDDPQRVRAALGYLTRETRLPSVRRRRIQRVEQPDQDALPGT